MGQTHSRLDTDLIPIRHPRRDEVDILTQGTKFVQELAEELHSVGREWIDRKLGYEERLEAVAHAIVEKGK
jgi:hypothetical protein